MKRIKVVAALIEKNDRVLIAQRLKGHLAGKWEFPGGKVENGETEADAIIREMYEEFNISVKCDGFVCNNVFIDNDKEIDLRLYRCTYLSGEVVLQDHSSYVFVDKKLLLSYDLADADIDLAKYVVNN